MLAALLTITVAACSPFPIVNHLSPSGHFEQHENLAYGSLERQTLDVYTPRASAGKSPLVVFFYGGGWRKGKKENYEFVASSLTKAGYTVVIPDYRLYPEVVFPAFIEDGAQAVAWILQNADTYNVDTDKVFLMGHSAGAHTAALLSLDASYLARHDIDARTLTGLVGLSGPYDFLPIESGYLLDVFPEASRAASQPVNFATTEAPPTLLIHGTDDNVVRFANSERLARRLTENGVNVTFKPYKGAGHAIVAASLAPPLNFAGDTLEDSREFLDAMK